jgi:hypothetical protein
VRVKENWQYFISRHDLLLMQMNRMIQNPAENCEEMKQGQNDRGRRQGGGQLHPMTSVDRTLSLF